MRTLIRANHVYAPGVPDADSLLIEDGLIAWLGLYSAFKNLEIKVDQVIEVPDSFVAPGFVDSHVHLSATGAQITGLDLRGATSTAQAIEILRKHVAATNDDFIIGHGWEDTNWPDRNLWNFESVREIVGNRILYLSRIDVHSALVITPKHCGIVKQTEHHDVRSFLQSNLPTQQRRADILAALELAASQGIVSVHENGGPFVSGEADFLDVLDLARIKNVPQVFAYWGSTDLDQVSGLGAFGAAGDLTVDGSIGSRTALLHNCYLDDETLGTEFLQPGQIAEHLVGCTKAGIQGGFHAIGDGALSNIIEGIELAIAQVGIEKFRFAKHRIEHAEMLDLNKLNFLANAGVILSMQPVFDELWGNPGGLYEQRLGKDRAAQMNAFNAISKAGITLAFSSDSPVTPINPWRAIKAATEHHTATHRISARAAFSAHTRGGWRASGNENNGVLAPGLPANISIWEVQDYTIKIPDERVRAWSTDVRSGTPPLPDLTDSLPKCVMTLRDGSPIWDPNKYWQK